MTGIVLTVPKWNIDAILEWILKRVVVAEIGDQHQNLSLINTNSAT